MVDALRTRLRRCFAVLFAGATLLCLAAPEPAAAQGWFGNFFGGGRQQTYGNAPPYPGYEGGGYGYGYGYGDGQGYYRSRRVRRRAPRAAEPKVDRAQQEAPAKPKAPAKPPTVFVGVFGDSLGQLLANGLDEALADRPEVGVLHKAKGSTGLANKQFFDWQKSIDDLLASKDKNDEIDVAVMMIGSNDRQPISEDGKTYEPDTPEWNAIYRKRVTAIDEAFAKKKIPLVWVGVPITKDDDFADAMAKLNEIYRDCAAATGATYIDTWEPFSDDDGDFTTFGPDINGQTVRLRSSDGIHFTRAGARKLAHFVEGQVRRDLDGKTPPPQLPTAETTPAEKKEGAPVAVKPEAGPIRNLGEVPSAKDGRLIDTTALAARDAGASKLETHEEAKRPPVGRADDFRWPAAPSPAPAKP